MISLAVAVICVTFFQTVVVVWGERQSWGWGCAEGLGDLLLASERTNDLARDCSCRLTSDTAAAPTWRWKRQSGSVETDRATVEDSARWMSTLNRTCATTILLFSRALSIGKLSCVVVNNVFGSFGYCLRKAEAYAGFLRPRSTFFEHFSLKYNSFFTENQWSCANSSIGWGSIKQQTKHDGCALQNVNFSKPLVTLEGSFLRV